MPGHYIAQTDDHTTAADATFVAETDTRAQAGFLLGVLEDKSEAVYYHVDATSEPAAVVGAANANLSDLHPYHRDSVPEAAAKRKELVGRTASLESFVDIQ